MLIIADLFDNIFLNIFSSNFVPIDLFDLKDVNTGSPIFDIKKLDWINGIYIRSFSQEELIQKLKEYADRTNLKIPETGALPKLIELAQPRMSTFQDFFVLIEPVFSFKKEVLNREEVDLAKITIGKLQELKSWTKDSILIALRKLMEKHKVKMPFFYVLITGRREGLPLPEIIEILGKDETLRRLKEAI